MHYQRRLILMGCAQHTSVSTLLREIVGNRALVATGQNRLLLYAHLLLFDIEVALLKIGQLQTHFLHHAPALLSWIAWCLCCRLSLVTVYPAYQLEL